MEIDYIFLTPGNLMKNLFCGPFWNWYFKTVFWKLLSRSTLSQFSATVTTIHSFMAIFLKFLGIHITDATFRSDKVQCTIYIFATRLEYKICFSLLTVSFRVAFLHVYVSALSHQRYTRGDVTSWCCGKARGWGNTSCCVSLHVLYKRIK